MAERLHHLHDAVAALIAAHSPDRVGIEEVFVNKNPQSTLKLAQARGAVLAACGRAGVPVREHAARLVKKAVVGTGAAEKAQVQAMLKVLLPGAQIAGADDVESDEDGHTIWTDMESLHEVAGGLQKVLGEPESVKLAWKPNLTVDVAEAEAGTLFKLVDALEDDDDVQTVWGNYTVSDEVAEKLG
jgi:hypothetical protein